MKKQTRILLIFFIIAIAFRLYFALQIPNFTYESYFDYRQIQSITGTGIPTFQDPLSFSGRLYLFSPFFHYILALFLIIFRTNLILKIMPNILASSLVFITYLISKKITNDKNIALFTSFTSIFIPIFITQTLNNISVYSITIPLIFLTIYSLMSENKKSIYYTLLSIFLLILFHPSSFIIIFALLIYLILTKIEKLKTKRQEIELILFSTFLYLWINFLIYKKAFLEHGIFIIWQNLPSQILNRYFLDINIIESLFNIGWIPLIFGIYIVYKYLFKEKNKNIYLLISFVIATALLLWLRLIKFNLGLSILGITLIILSSQAYKLSLNYFKKTRISNQLKYFIMLFIAIFFITSIIPSFYFSAADSANIPSMQEIRSLSWLKSEANEEDVIMAIPKEGFLINAISQRKNIADLNFLLIENPSRVLEDIDTLFTTYYKTTALSILEKYDAKYIFFTGNARKRYNISNLKFISEEDKCFEQIYENEKSKIYKVNCKLEQLK